MYVIEDGEFEVLYSGEVVGLLKSGKAFGETALMYNCPRTATIRCKTPSKLWAIDRETFRRIIMTESIKRRALYQDFLSKVPLLENLLDYERAKVADALEPIIFKDGDVIIRQGSTDLDGFYIIEEGTVRCTKGPDPLPEGAPAPGAEVEAIRLGPGDYFGELALLTNKPRAATVSSVGTTKCLRITKKHFDQVMGPCEQVLMRNMRTYTSYVDLQKGTKQQRAMSQHKVSSNGSPQDQSDVDQSANPSSSHPEGQDDESTTTEGQARSSNAMDEDSVVPSPAPSAGQTVSLRRQSARNADRQEIVMRAIVSEEEYVAILRKIVGGYLVGMLHTPELKVSPQDIEIIFANAEELCQIHSNFLEALKRASVDSIQLLQVMKSLISQLHHYLPFIQCFYSSILIRRKRKSVPSFSSFLKTIRENDKEDLDGLLDHPFRRVNHYAQLVLDLYQTASQDNSKEAFHVLIQEVRSILASLEEARVRAEQVYGILRNITGEVEFAQNPSREFVHEGRLAITSDKTSNLVYAFLFNDILVCATQIETGMGKPKLAHYITVPLSSCVYRSTTTHFTLEWGKGESGAKEGISFARDQIWESHLLRVLSGLHPGNPSEAAQ
jgi:CRP-like cAMP-binding protein